MDERPPRSPNPKPEVDLALRPIEPGGPLFAAALFDKVMGPKAFLSLPTQSLLFPGLEQVGGSRRKIQDTSRFRCKG